MRKTFSDVLDMVEALSMEDKEMLLDIVRKRVTEQRREEMWLAVDEADAEFEAGLCKTASVDDIMAEVRR
ncbi:MAG: hypothetical protein ABL999_15350 [Pyrinomonadaceae bacterium]